MPVTLNSKISSNDATTTGSEIATKDLLLEKLPIAIFICDFKGILTYSNKAAAKLCGRKPEVGIDLRSGALKLYHADGSLIENKLSPISETIDTGKPVKDREIIVERENGKRKHAKLFTELTIDGNGKSTGIIVTLIDITEEKKKETQAIEKDKKFRRLSESVEKIVEKRISGLKKSEEKYHKMIVEIQDYAILLLDENGNIMNWNRGAEKIKGYSDVEVIGKNFSIFYLEEDQKAKLPQKLINEAKKNGRAMHEGFRVRKDGTTFWGYIVITALHNESGKVIGYSKVTRDLTERKLAEDQMKSFAHDIEIRNHQLEEYAYIASHDLQEPIRKIQIFSELLKDDIDNKENILKNAEKINKSAQRMSQLIKEVLKYSQLSKNEELIQPTDLNLIFQNVIDDLDLFISEKNAVIIKSDLPVIKAIPVQMHQLFFNLIGNAIKFAQKKPVVKVEATILHPNTDKTEKMLELTFSDNGIGFDQQYENQVFKLFKRLNTSHTGTGIGLALCKKIVENHNGQISVASSIGQGTSFHISLPML